MSEAISQLIDSDLFWPIMAIIYLVIGILIFVEGE